MTAIRIVEPRVVGGETRLALPPEVPSYVVKAIHQVNVSGEEMVLELADGQRAVLGPGTDLEPLADLVGSPEFLDALEDAVKNRNRP